MFSQSNCHPERKKGGYTVFLQKTSKTFFRKTNKRITGMSKEFIERFTTTGWKGNIRELKTSLNGRDIS
jgi:DNA-binding NtrC family response regulator